MIFSEYADFYDIYYAEKDYGAEVDFVLELADSLVPGPKTYWIWVAGREVIWLNS